jgi:phage terminase large subunit GpA-like protein
MWGAGSTFSAMCPWESEQPATPVPWGVPPVAQPVAWHNPPKFKGKLSKWIEEFVWLPPGLVAQPGKMKLYPYQREIADCIGDETIERITLQKSVRVGFTTLLSACIFYYLKERPGPILVVLPVESDTRDYIVSDIEPIGECSPLLRGVISPVTHRIGDRSLMTHRVMHESSLKIVSSKAPRNLRRHTAKVLICDEIDAYDLAGPNLSRTEGNPLTLAERRTLSFPDRKIICGSTPKNTDTSFVAKLYNQSDMRVFEVPCFVCGAFNEIVWANIEWNEGDPYSAYYRCPHCRAKIDEINKPRMVAAGVWRKTRPEVRGHAGFKLNALVSVMANASWPNLAVEFLNCRNEPDSLRVFTNTLLSEPWDAAEGSEFQEDALQARAEDWSLADIPAEVISLTCGVDTQDNRLEVSTCGWTRTNECLVLDHRVFFGHINTEPDLLVELDDFLTQSFAHPSGGRMKIDCVVMDCADGGTHQKVLQFTGPRTHRKVLAGRGGAGFERLPLARNVGKSRLKAGRNFWIIGIDGLKSKIFDRLAKGTSIRFSNTLTDDYYYQLCSEKRVIRMARGRPVARFEVIRGKRNETLDCLCYAFAAHSVVNLNLDEREDMLKTATTVNKPPIPEVIRSQFMSR